jgi:ketosteroid isomerase-like protein
LSEINLETMHPVMVRQLDCLARRDITGLLENYTPDAALVRLDGQAQGLPEVKEAFTAYLALEPEVVELTGYAQTDDVIFYHARMKLGGQPEDSVGTLVLRDGKIWRQTAYFG